MQELDEIILCGIATYHACTWYYAIKDTYALSRFLKRETTNKEIKFEEALRQDLYD